MATNESTAIPETSVTLGHFEDALEEQRRELWEAEATIEMVILALEREFGRDWPAARPNFPMVLRRATTIVRTAAEQLECATLKARALELGISAGL